ncbi:hypothetical protein B0T18DRAFT_394949 [Schizothecium vesticola]|uniref:Uncharacterized protein n=1 Tax=Schizothecium vesticola TaxID=314040 RepID=A0AA40EHS2_9PEZI|nr:hypothetical protein B0T18DRAFT_394949 [Schizothecium vesticola]
MLLAPQILRPLHPRPLASKASYALWASTSGFQHRWDGVDPEECNHGWFLEVFFPTAGRMSGDITSDERDDSEITRDRLLISTRGENLARKRTARSAALPGGSTVLRDRVKVQGKKNLVVSRSAQDFTMHRGTVVQERKDAESIIKGAATLFTNRTSGCYSCRYMKPVNLVPGESTTDVTSLLVCLDDLAGLEAPWLATWVKKRLNVEEFYEVMMVRREQQMFEYIACHGEAGMLVTYLEERRAYLAM